MRTRVMFLAGMLCGLALVGVMGVALGGSLTPPGGPNDASTAMYTLDSIWQRLTDGTAGTKRGAGFVGPVSGPQDSGHDLNEVMAKCPVKDDVNGVVASQVPTGKTFWGLTSAGWGTHTGTGTRTLSATSVSVSAGYYEATTLTEVESDLTGQFIVQGTNLFGVVGTYPVSAVVKTGQTTSYATGDDGALLRGVAWPTPRYTDNGDGTVTDNMTGLMWLKNAYQAGVAKTWADAITYCNDLVDSGYSDWRLPSRNELASLLDFGQNSPPLLPGHPFTNVQGTWYWSSTTYAGNTAFAWYVGLDAGAVAVDGKTSTRPAWPVRGGQ